MTSYKSTTKEAQTENKEDPTNIALPMPSLVSHEAVQAARRSAKRKRAAKACTSCKEKKAKCSGFSPCTRYINPGDKQFHHSTSAAGSIAKAQRPQSVQAPALHSFGLWYRPLGQFSTLVVSSECPLLSTFRTIFRSLLAASRAR